jgi:hypothetical protein
MHPLGLRFIVLRAHENNFSFREISKKENVSIGTVHTWCKEGYEGYKRREKEGTNAKKKIPRRKRKLNDTVILKISDFIKQVHNCLTIKHIQIETGLSRKTATSALRLLNLTRKRAGPPLGGNPTQEQVDNHCDNMLKRKESRLLWSVDECYFSEKIVPLHCYCEPGKRVRARSSLRSWKHHTLLLAMSNRGHAKYQIFEGGCNRVLFEPFVKTLPGDIICDNASIHKGFEMKNRYFVPPYSPLPEAMDVRSTP